MSDERGAMAEWSFLTNHAKALLCIADDPGARLRDIAALLGITERSAFAIVNDLTAAGYVVKERDGRRNRYEIQHHLPLREEAGRERTIGELLDVLRGTTGRDHDRVPSTRRKRGTAESRVTSR
jgi:DNA-binding MarR family transcriptional regulator